MQNILGVCTFLGGIAAVWFFWEKFTSKNNVDSSPALKEIARKLDHIGVGLDSEKNMRAVKFLLEGGYGNQHYKDFLLWAFRNLEEGIVAAFKSSSFDSLCKDNGIIIETIEDSQGRELFLKATRGVSRAVSFWNGSSYFFGIDKETFGAYFKERKISINKAALNDFRKLHELFLGYTNAELPLDSLHKEISPDGMVPPDY
jgi:hypothetical protein